MYLQLVTMFMFKALRSLTCLQLVAMSVSRDLTQVYEVSVWSRIIIRFFIKCNAYFHFVPLKKKIKLFIKSIIFAFWPFNWTFENSTRFFSAFLILREIDFGEKWFQLYRILLSRFLTKIFLKEVTILGVNLTKKRWERIWKVK